MCKPGLACRILICIIASLSKKCVSTTAASLQNTHTAAQAPSKESTIQPTPITLAMDTDESDTRTEPLLPVDEGSAVAQGTDDADEPHHYYHSNSTTTAPEETGSTLRAAIFNFTNTIVGAGAIGLGGAMAQSGGLISVLAILFFAVLTKRSLDLVVELANSTGGGSYEGLAYHSLGRRGWIIVSLSKFLYSFGCLVAYLVVMKDNLGPSLVSLGRRTIPHWNDDAWWVHSVLDSPERFTWAVAFSCLLPLCLLRDMTPLANFSLLSIALMATLTSIVIYLYWANPEDLIRQNTHDFYVNWLQIRPGFLEALGTYVFAFVSQHTVHLTYQSLKPSVRTVPNFAKVTSWSIGIATTLTLLVGLAVYMSFWQKAGTGMIAMCYFDATSFCLFGVTDLNFYCFPFPQKRTCSIVTPTSWPPTWPNFF